MTDSEARHRRAMAAFDWLVRVYAPAFLRLADLHEHAETLAGIRQLISPKDSAYV